MSYLQHRQRLKIRLQKARLKQPLRTSAEAYAGMERMQASASGRTNGDYSTVGRVHKD